MSRGANGIGESAYWHVVPLGERLDCLPTLAVWMYREWLRPEGESLERACEILRSRAWCDSIPATWVAVDRERTPCGMVSLSTLYLPHGEQAGCLSSLYVTPESRGRGLGTTLCHHAVQAAQTLGLERLMLRTHDKVTFYEQRGWQRWDRRSASDGGSAPVLMQYVGNATPDDVPTHATSAATD